MNSAQNNFAATKELSKNNNLKYLLPFLICIIGEICMYTIFKKSLGPHISPIVFTLLGLGVGFTFIRILLASYKGQFLYNNASALESTKNIKYYKYAPWILLICIGLWYWKLAGLFHSLPINFDTDPPTTGSDVIPNVMSYVKRTVAGEFPYQPIRGKEWSYTLMPTYVTMTWLPYLPAEMLNFDYRWIPVIALTICLIVYYRQSKQLKNNPLFFWIAFIAPIFFLYFYTRFNKEELKLTVEGLVAAYYFMLAFSLAQKRLSLIIAAVLLCILSRFSLLFWLPLLVLVVFHECGIKSVVKSISICIVGVVLLYGIFMIKDPMIFAKAVKYYGSATLGEWTIADWLLAEGGKHPFSLSRGVGWAIWFYDYVQGSLEYKINVLKKVQMIAVMLTTALLCWHYWKHRNHVNGFLYALAGLKISLVMFYSFVQIPYTYLYVLPVLLNLPLLMLGLQIMNGNKKQTPSLKQ